MSSSPAPSDRDAHVAAYRSQRLLRVRVGSSIPAFWRFVQWVGKETNVLTGEWEDVVLCEYDPEWVEAT